MSEAPLQLPSIDRQRNFSIVTPVPLPQRDSDILFSFFINTQDGVRVGDIRARRDGIVVFEASNTRRLQRGKPESERGIVSRAIAEIVASGVVDRWYSHTGVSDDAKHMYNVSLRRDNRLQVLSPDESTGGRYLVMRQENIR